MTMFDEIMICVDEYSKVLNNKRMILHWMRFARKKRKLLKVLSGLQYLLTTKDLILEFIDFVHTNRNLYGIYDLYITEDAKSSVKLNNIFFNNKMNTGSISFCIEEIESINICTITVSFDLNGDMTISNNGRRINPEDVEELIIKFIYRFTLYIVSLLELNYIRD